MSVHPYRKVLLAVVAMAFSACHFQPPPPLLTQLQLRQLQSRSYDNRDLKTAMRAVINALLDEGFIIKNADKDLGFIQASKEIDLNDGGPMIGLGTAFGTFGDQQPRYRNSSVVDCSGTLTTKGNSTNVRLIFQRKTLDNFGVSMDVNVVTDPNFYQDIFVKIDKSLFLENEGGLLGR